MSPSPEFPHSPVDQTAFDKNIESVLEEVEKANLNKNKKMNFKWKSGVSKYIHTYLHAYRIMILSTFWRNNRQKIENIKS